MNNNEIVLDDIQKSIIDRIENTNDNLFITGKAGSGKSVIIKELIRRSLNGESNKYVIPLAFTGIAALNIGGQTINSYFKIYEESFYDYEDIFETSVLDITTDDNVAINIGKAELLVIDEISMVRADLFRAIDLLCRRVKNEPNKFFGGIQLVMFGDMYQLPPVIVEPTVEDSYSDTGECISKYPVRDYLKSHFNGVYFFNCPDVLDNIQFIELDKIYRQEDIDFINILNNIRVGKDLPETLRLLNTRVVPPDKDSKYITLCTTNKTADITNNDRLNILDSPLIEHEGTIQGIANELPTLKKLKLKVGAHVMTLVNDNDYRNGSIGVVEEIDLEHETLQVRLFNNDRLVKIKPYVWEYAVYKYDSYKGSYSREVVGTFRQWPVKLAWAVTIHKSQGQTFDSVYLKPGNFFSTGQTYVALSRCRSLEKLYLARPIELKDIMVSERVKEFMNTMRSKKGGPNEKW